MKIRLRYFASLREATGQAEETLTVADGLRIADIKTQLLERYPQLQQQLPGCICAVNRGYVPVETVLHENDELVFIPPTGGGDIGKHTRWNQ